MRKLLFCLKRQNRKMIWRWLHCIALKRVQSKSTMSFYNQACSMWSEWTLVHMHSQCCYIHVSHCTKQQVPLPVPYSLKLNWACTCSEAACLTQSSVSSSQSVQTRKPVISYAYNCPEIGFLIGYFYFILFDMVCSV